jgi:hypothetical protein
MQVLPNTGIMHNDALDKLRGDAIIECRNGLPKPLVCYLNALESRYLDLIAQQHRRSALEVGWRHIAKQKEGGE